MQEKQIIYTLLTYVRGELHDVRLYSTQDLALKAAARHVYTSFDDQFVALVSTEDTIDDMREFIDNLKELYAHEAYREFVECWDDWVVEVENEGPAPLALAAFTIEELEVDGEGR